MSESIFNVNIDDLNELQRQHGFVTAKKTWTSNGGPNPVTLLVANLGMMHHHYEKLEVKLAELAKQCPQEYHDAFYLSAARACLSNHGTPHVNAEAAMAVVRACTITFNSGFMSTSPNSPNETPKEIKNGFVPWFLVQWAGAIGDPVALTQLYAFLFLSVCGERLSSISSPSVYFLFSSYKEATPAVTCATPHLNEMLSSFEHHRASLSPEKKDLIAALFCNITSKLGWFLSENITQERAAIFFSVLQRYLSFDDLRVARASVEGTVAMIDMHCRAKFGQNWATVLKSVSHQLDTLTRDMTELKLGDKTATDQSAYGRDIPTLADTADWKRASDIAPAVSAVNFKKLGK